MTAGTTKKGVDSTSKVSEPTKWMLLRPCWSEPLVVDNNHARQLLVAQERVRVPIDGPEPVITLASGESIPIVRSTGAPVKGRAIYVPARTSLDVYEDFADIQNCSWLGEKARSTPEAVLESLRDAFEFRDDRPDENRFGLREPQLGALHSLLGYWTTDASEPATIVMPTGTGKTETMLAVYAHQRIPRLLVLVPSDNLRQQISKKFEELGLLHSLGILRHTTRRPIVGQVKHGFSNAKSAQAFVNGCNVVVTTPNALDASKPAARRRVLKDFTHLFVDEAHHLGAKTWQSIRDEFSGRRVVQFTATPFREDGRHLKGRIVYAFPLRRAQEQRYFAGIDYVSIAGAADPDTAIATRAVARLREDLANGYDHLIMARVHRIARTVDLTAVYGKLAPEFAPVVLHSSSASRERSDALAAIRNRTSRIVICVDMLGEGFDLPELKIAAIHDAHKSMGVTLQFVGRFARGKASLGTALVVVGRPGFGLDTRLLDLYRENADWNKVIRNLSQEAVDEVRETSEFDSAFSARTDSLTTHNLEPKMSAVVFRTDARSWRLNALPSAFKENQIFGSISVNARDHVAWFVTRNVGPVSWGIAPELTELSYDLYILYWDASRRLLYINSSNTDSHHEQLAKVLMGPSAAKIRGETVYRAMSGISRLVPTNVGVLDTRSHARRFSMHVGADVSEGFPIAEQVVKTQTNIFATGFQNGARLSIGASLKGRIWSYRVARSLREWTSWCDSIGAKLLNDSLSIDSILKSFIRPKPIEARPALVFLSAEWPWELFENTTNETRVKLNEREFALADADLRITSFETSGDVPFEVVTPDWTASYTASFTPQGTRYSATGVDATVVGAKQTTPLSEFLSQHGLTFHLEKDALVVHPSTLLQPMRDLPPFDSTKIQPINWTGIDLRKESQGPQRDASSIQARMVRYLNEQPEWRIILDDDGSGEAADLVALSTTERELRVLLVHCKYASTGGPARRVEDLYELCGQAQKSARWGRDFGVLLEHLERRERNRRARNAPTGFMRGDLQMLHSVMDRVRSLKATFSIAIVQPGLSRAAVTESQLALLASTEVFLNETYLASLTVYSSA